MAIPARLRSKLSEFVNIGLAKGQALIITKAQSEIRKKLEQIATECPPPEVLIPIVTFINNTRPIIEHAERRVSEANKIADQLEPAIVGGRLLIEILSKNPLPQVIFNGVPTPITSVFFTPFFVVQETKGMRNTSAAILEWARDLIETLEDEGRAISDGVQAAQGVLAPVKNQLNQLEALVQACLQNQELTDEERKLLIDNLTTKLPQDPAFTGLSYTSRSGRNYTIKIVNVENSPEVAQKRQAIVQDFRGITVLTGPESFASKTQVLIDEIKFRIENQLP